jgi:hypothetical protein
MVCSGGGVVGGGVWRWSQWLSRELQKIVSREEELAGFSVRTIATIMNL